MTSPWIIPPTPSALGGAETFSGLDADVRDFWAFAMSDLRMNNVRGYLAEFLVARAVRATGLRVEWDAYDVLTPSGVRVEVKSAAYLQTWDQRKLSAIRFTGLKGRTWSPKAGHALEATLNADVYVFAVQTSREHDGYDPLDVTAWAFYVMSRNAVEATGHSSLGLTTIEASGIRSVTLDQLAFAIENAATEGDGILGQAINRRP